ncbi:MAG: 4Fe-4S binding protein [Methanoregula sp.]|nr:4Fe-4S binding protein [Methanoregula sp.]MDD5023562.1 4Fe-4S binding protein [Methanoregula sp.]MDD5188380.1 4Fe-4S binding protein [Methanoregula sp.]
MAFAVHVNMERCTGCGNCVVACPVNALELHTLDPVTKEKIYTVIDGRSVSLDIRAELCAGCGVCVEACPYRVIRLSGKGELPLPAQT